MKGSVIIDCFPENAARYTDGYAIVAIDVMRATTTATTAVDLGMRVFPARSTDDAFILAASLKDPLLVGEIGGNKPYGFELTNSPVQVSSKTFLHRPMVLVSTSGTQLILNSAGSEAVYIACFRNFSAVADYISERHERVAIIGAGTRGQFRREDQMGCAWVAEKLVKSGYCPENEQTSQYISRWSGVSPAEAKGGRSAEYLRSSGQVDDLEFIISHYDDVNTVPAFVNGELIRI